MEDVSSSLPIRQSDNGSIPESADDQAAAFRFLDLLPEMRNLIYGHLLTLTPRASQQSPSSCFGSCHPQILATCRQIYTEAAGLLECSWNTQQPFNILIHADWLKRSSMFQRSTVHTMQLYKTVQIHNRGIYKATQTDFEQLQQGYLAYPSYLRRVKRLHIQVDIGTDTEEYFYGSIFVGSAAFGIACIHTLVDFLMQGNSLRELSARLNLELAENSTQSAILNALAPLQRLRNVEIVDVSGLFNGIEMQPVVWEPVITDIQTKTVSPPMNVLAKMRDIYHLCSGISERDDDDDERQGEHKLLRIFYRYIIWEIHFGGTLIFPEKSHFQISEHLSWMKRLIVDVKERDKRASQNSHGGCERTESSAQAYWNVLKEAAAGPSPSGSVDLRAGHHDWHCMNSSRGPHRKEVLDYLETVRSMDWTLMNLDEYWTTRMDLHSPFGDAV